MRKILQVNEMEKEPDVVGIIVVVVVVLVISGVISMPFYKKKQIMHLHLSSKIYV